MSTANLIGKKLPDVAFELVDGTTSSLHQVCESGKPTIIECVFSVAADVALQHDTCPNIASNRTSLRAFSLLALSFYTSW